ncbi:VWA domain-containing protein [Dyadobacter luticola]|uniref:VWA domain-containing protein n=1 Tax=Dyadobacter luticola TaxID=1979387 RepID=A0A5R9L1G4_9BACT|nr:VWA domain-containing protein [Dyadobacter luticola]TLV02217.1 VWA domain-containing protein [Dyadobacter luticola]
MKRFLPGLFIVILNVAAAFAQTETPQHSLNNYIEFLNRSTAELTGRFQMVTRYTEDVELYRKRPSYGLRLPSSGPLEEFYYKKALTAQGLTAAEKQKLNKGANAVWDILNELDETAKALETHVKLNAYQEDDLKESDRLVSKILSAFWRYRAEKVAFYKEINGLALKKQPYLATDPYMATEKEMRDILIRQQQLLDSLPFYLNRNSQTEWPLAMVKRSMLADEKSLADFGKLQARLPYPASASVPDFKEALYALQKIKRTAVDDHNFASRQSAEHGNKVYLSLINQYNFDLMAAHQAFVNYSQAARPMIYFPAFSPVMVQESASEKSATTSPTPAYEDLALIRFETKRSATPAPTATIETLNGYVELINESLRQMHLLQLLVRNYQSSAEFYRDPARAGKRGNLTYSHAEFKVPISAYQLLTNASNNIPAAYRASINGQAKVLLNILKEMDGLSVELIRYTTEKTYLTDQLKRSDAILDRYVVLFDLFDQKKEQLYQDIRRIHESFPNMDPASSWTVSGNALLQTMDQDHDILFGLKDYFKGRKSNLPPTEKLAEDAKKLIADEYKNMKGLKRYGRANGNCPYSPYEDLPANSIRLAEMVQKIKPNNSAGQQHPFESFYYFYNNALVYEYNKFIDLSQTGLLKTINQPDLFAFQRISAQKPENPQISPPAKTEKPADAQPISTITSNETIPNAQPAKPVAATTERQAEVRRDTVYIERVKVDTVYVDRGNNGRETTRSLEGFAANNMVLLLDVSSSMNSPLKMPLLKRSIKSLLTLLRAEDQISVILYSGKARVVLKPTSGSKSAEIARMIDLLKSDGDTNGNEGIKLAYKTANKQYIRGGNNRIVLATDGEFPVSEEVMQMIGQNAHQDLYLTVFTFGRNEHTGQKLRKLSELGQGTYAHVTEESADLQLILEAQAKKQAVR